MNQSGRFTFSRRNAIFLAVCLAGLSLLLLVAIVPLKSQRQALDQELDALQKDLASQRQNQTSITMVDGILAKLDQQPGPQVVTLAALPQDKSDQILEDARSMANEASLTLARLEPLLDDSSTWQSLTVRAELHGLFPDLRIFLLKLLTLPYVKQIERLEVHPDASGLKFSLTYTIALA